MASDDIRSEIVSLLPRLRLFAYSLTRSADDGDDLVQGTCERALKSIGSWEPGTRLDSWMFRIMRNHWIDRARRRRLEGSVLAFNDEEIASGEDGHGIVEAREELAAVRAAILTLPEEQRSVLVLVCIEELSYRETAAVLDVPIGTVMSRLARARQKIADIASGSRAPGSVRSTGERP